MPNGFPHRPPFSLIGGHDWQEGACRAPHRCMHGAADVHLDGTGSEVQNIFPCLCFALLCPSFEQVPSPIMLGMQIFPTRFLPLWCDLVMGGNLLF